MFLVQQGIRTIVDCYLTCKYYVEGCQNFTYYPEELMCFTFGNCAELNPSCTYCSSGSEACPSPVPECFLPAACQGMLIYNFLIVLDHGILRYLPYPSIKVNYPAFHHILWCLNTSKFNL